MEFDLPSNGHAGETRDQRRRRIELQRRSVDRDIQIERRFRDVVDQMRPAVRAQMGVRHNGQYMTVAQKEAVLKKYDTYMVKKAAKAVSDKKKVTILQPSTATVNDIGALVKLGESGTSWSKAITSGIGKAAGAFFHNPGLGQTIGGALQMVWDNRNLLKKTWDAMRKVLNRSSVKKTETTEAEREEKITQAMRRFANGSLLTLTPGDTFVQEDTLAAELKEPPGKKRKNLGVPDQYFSFLDERRREQVEQVGLNIKNLVINTSKLGEFLSKFRQTLEAGLEGRKDLTVVSADLQNLSGHLVKDLYKLPQDPTPDVLNELFSSYQSVISGMKKWMEERTDLLIKLNDAKNAVASTQSEKARIESDFNKQVEYYKTVTIPELIVSQDEAKKKAAELEATLENLRIQYRGLEETEKENQALISGYRGQISELTNSMEKATNELVSVETSKNQLVALNEQYFNDADTLRKQLITIANDMGVVEPNIEKMRAYFKQRIEEAQAAKAEAEAEKEKNKGLLVEIENQKSQIVSLEKDREYNLKLLEATKQSLDDQAKAVVKAQQEHATGLAQIESSYKQRLLEGGNRIKELESNVKDLDITIKKQKGEIESKELILKEKESLIEQNAQKIVAAQNAVTKSEGIVANMKKKVEELETTIEDLEKQQAKNLKNFDDKTQLMLSEKQDVINRSKATIGFLEKENKKLRNANERSWKLFKEKNMRIAELEQSLYKTRDELKKAKEEFGKVDGVWNSLFGGSDYKSKKNAVKELEEQEKIINRKLKIDDEINAVDLMIKKDEQELATIPQQFQLDRKFKEADIEALKKKKEALQKEDEQLGGKNKAIEYSRQKYQAIAEDYHRKKRDYTRALLDNGGNGPMSRKTIGGLSGASLVGSAPDWSLQPNKKIRQFWNAFYDASFHPYF